jgi:hypothetical protein
MRDKGGKPWDARLVDWMSRGSSRVGSNKSTPQSLVIGAVSGLAVATASQSVMSFGIVVGVLIVVVFVWRAAPSAIARLRRR